ncbi:hypothetical protein CEXT_650671 [Caerostris extrusa]|uniref:Uncharacterized protein n=1 Tax=Caerostris extrusa TaxID=172846 RepID=A0AAV4NU45_CAEEX|nr:hypothetical protein CEXT_650671 [Caerostris extrusa]
MQMYPFHLNPNFPNVRHPTMNSYTLRRPAPYGIIIRFRRRHPSRQSCHKYSASKRAKVPDQYWHLLDPVTVFNQDMPRYVIRNEELLKIPHVAEDSRMWVPFFSIPSISSHS